MFIKTNIRISFDPIAEYCDILEFEKEHPDYVKHEDSTLATTFEKTDIYFKNPYPGKETTLGTTLGTSNT